MAIESATSLCAVAVGGGSGLIFEHSVFTDRQHNETLPGLVRQALAEAETSYADLRAIIVSIGPGSFTGLRVGVSFAKGVAVGLGVPLVPVPTLLVLAESILLSHPAISLVAPLIPARKGESFGQIFEVSSNSVEQKSEPFLADLKFVAALIERGIKLAGEGANMFRNEIDVKEIVEDVTPSASVLLRLGLKLLADPAYSPPSVSGIEPLYLKEFTVKARNIG